MTAEEALRQAEAEGLTLVRSESSSTGYKGVSFNSGRTKPYKAEVRRGGKQVALGMFATAEEAALVVARTPEGRAAAAAAAAAPPAPPPMTAEEALRQAEAEGLTLLRSGGSMGYKGVSFYSSSKTKTYKAEVWRGGKAVCLGSFATAEEAALAYARSPEAQAAAAAAAAAPPKPPPMTAEEALRRADAEGLTLLRAESNSSGYKGVAFSSTTAKSKPYLAQVRRGGQAVSIGSFATAEEAALVLARTPEGRAAVAAAAAAAAPPAPPPMTAEEALRQAEAEGLTLVRSERSNSGFRGVNFNCNCKTTPYKAAVQRGGKPVALGMFATAEEAALVVARTPEGRAAAAAAIAAAVALTAGEALHQATWRT